jgi:HAD superfamily hydrolase (TIGR01549 family)
MAFPFLITHFTPSPKEIMMKAVIFDIDGTLVDSVDLHAEAWAATFRKYGKTIDFQAVRRQIGKGSDQLLPVFFSNQELTEFGEQMEKERDELFKRDYLPQVKGFPKTRELFERIKQDGKPIVLASSAKGEELETYKRLAGIADLIEGETSSEDVEQSKPHPDIFAAALKKLGNPPGEDIIVVGDTPYDAEAAGKLNLRTIGVLCGGWTAEELGEAGCVAIYRDPADLLAGYAESLLATETSRRVPRSRDVQRSREESTTP